MIDLSDTNETLKEAIRQKTDFDSMFGYKKIFVAKQISCLVSPDVYKLAKFKNGFGWVKLFGTSGSKHGNEHGLDVYKASKDRYFFDSVEEAIIVMSKEVHMDDVSMLDGSRELLEYLGKLEKRYHGE